MLLVVFKMLSFSRKNMNIKNIFAYSDIRMFSGDVFKLMVLFK